MTITDFLKHFFPDAHEPIHLRLIAPRGVKAFPASIKMEVTRHRLATDTKLQTELKNHNKTRGVYFVVNSGGDKDDEITRINAVFCEMDERPIQEQIDIYLESSMPTPSLLVETKKSIHAYWLLEESILPSEFVRLQKGLIAHFKSDEKICNVSRVMRVPYFNHVAYVGGEWQYKQCTVQFALGHTYTFAELASEFPYEPPPKKVYKRVNAEPNNVNDLLVERIQQTPMYHENGEYGYTRGICHDGKGDNSIFVHRRTNAVKCFNGCSWHTIREAFGIDMERK